MILQHPETKEKKRVKNNYLNREHYRREGWIDVTPPRTPAQVEQSKRFLASGQLASLQTQLRNLIRTERNSLDPHQIATLNRTEIILQQLSKKYRSTKSPKK